MSLFTNTAIYFKYCTKYGHFSSRQQHLTGIYKKSAMRHYVPHKIRFRETESFIDNNQSLLNFLS